MAEDGVFFRQVAKVNRKTHVPVMAIVLQSIWTMVVALTGQVRADSELRGLDGFRVLRADRHDPVRVPQAPLQPRTMSGFRVPGHPGRRSYSSRSRGWWWRIQFISIRRTACWGLRFCCSGIPVYLVAEPRRQRGINDRNDVLPHRRPTPRTWSMPSCTRRRNTTSPPAE